MPAKRRVPLAFAVATIAVTACAARSSLPLNEYAPYSQTLIIDGGITSKETVLHSFRGPDGAGPAYGVIADKSGTLYGTTIFGGKSKSSAGVVFKLEPHGFNYEESVIYSFKGGRDGYRGLAGLAMDSKGALYGDTFGGHQTCFAGCGTVFKMTPTASGFKKDTIYLFNPAPDASQPVGTLVLDENGNVFGVTQYGGATNNGAVFELKPGSSGYTESVIYSFSGGTDGYLPQAGITIDDRDALYGTTQFGGNLSACAGGCGTVFKLTPNRRNGTYAKQTILDFNGKTDGYSPLGTLSVDNKIGAVYGTTWYGDDSTGTVFKLTPFGTGYSERVIHAFRRGTALPSGQLLIAPNGSLYGTTSENGMDPKCSCGIVFTLTPSGSEYSYRVVYHFGNQLKGDDPENTTLLMDSTGALIGTTRSGGASIKTCNDGTPGCGVAFRVLP